MSQALISKTTKHFRPIRKEIVSWMHNKQPYCTHDCRQFLCSKALQKVNGQSVQKCEWKLTEGQSIIEGYYLYLMLSLTDRPFALFAALSKFLNGNLDNSYDWQDLKTPSLCLMQTEMAKSKWQKYSPSFAHLVTILLRLQCGATWTNWT